MSGRKTSPVRRSSFAWATASFRTRCSHASTGTRNVANSSRPGPAQSSRCPSRQTRKRWPLPRSPLRPRVLLPRVPVERTVGGSAEVAKVGGALEAQRAASAQAAAARVLRASIAPPIPRPHPLRPRECQLRLCSPSTTIRMLMADSIAARQRRPRPFGMVNHTTTCSPRTTSSTKGGQRRQQVKKVASSHANNENSALARRGQALSFGATISP